MSQVASAVILAPLDITLANILSGTTVPEVDEARGEVAWVAGAHASGAVNVNCDGSLWTAVDEPGNVRPGTDTTKWRRQGPSNRMAPFDLMRSTAAESNGELLYVIKAPFFTGLRLDGLVGERLEITLVEIDGENETVHEHWEGDMYEQALGLFEYLYYPLRQIEQRAMFNLPLLANAQLRVRITASNNGKCAIGMMTLGFWESLLGNRPDFGGVEYGASAKIKTYTEISEKKDGSWEITPRRTGPAININCTVIIDAEQANSAFQKLKRAAGKPVAFIASNLGRYDYLNTFAILDAEISPPNWGMATLRITGRGSV